MGPDRGPSRRPTIELIAEGEIASGIAGRRGSRTSRRCGFCGRRRRRLTATHNQSRPEETPPRRQGFARRRCRRRWEEGCAEEGARARPPPALRRGPVRPHGSRSGRVGYLCYMTPVAMSCKVCVFRHCLSDLRQRNWKLPSKRRVRAVDKSFQKCDHAD
jgi:hypothetical protein